MGPNEIQFSSIHLFIYHTQIQTLASRLPILVWQISAGFCYPSMFPWQSSTEVRIMWLCYVPVLSPSLKMPQIYWPHIISSLRINPKQMEWACHAMFCLTVPLDSYFLLVSLRLPRTLIDSCKTTWSPLDFPEPPLRILWIFPGSSGEFQGDHWSLGESRRVQGSIAYRGDHSFLDLPGLPQPYNGNIYKCQLYCDG